MYRMYGIPQGARDGGAVMYRMYGIPQGARDGGTVMYRMYGIPQGARDSGAVMYRMYGQKSAPRQLLIWTPQFTQQVFVKKYRCVLIYGLLMGCYPGHLDVFAPSCLISCATLLTMYRAIYRLLKVGLTVLRSLVMATRLNFNSFLFVFSLYTAINMGS